jgi:hypothetical protein
MQRWEYLLVACVPYNRVMRPKFQNGEILPYWQDGTVPDYCNARGDEGWELISAVNDPISDKGSVIDLIFKRPVQPGVHSDMLRTMPSSGPDPGQADEPQTA